MVHSKNMVTILILSLSLLLLVFGCSKESTGPDTDPPVIPPQSTMIMDLSGFATSNQLRSFQGSVNDPGETLTRTNWNWAAANVVVWGTYVNLINITLAVPFFAFVGSFEQEADYQGDATWLWEKTFPFLGIQHTSQLYGSLVGDDVVWEMYITKDGAYSDFLWYKGEADVEATEGYWEFYKNPENPTPFLRVEWHRNEDQKGDIKYINVDSGSSDVNSYIFYDILEEGEFDSAFDMFSSSNDNHTFIEWHRVNKNGRVKDYDYFGDDLWHCWDENHDDIECP